MNHGGLAAGILLIGVATGCVHPTSIAPARSAAAEDLSRLGWYTELAGACWLGRDTTGAVTDRQCYQIQFGRYLRGTIEIGGSFRGDSVVGWDGAHGQIVMFFWSNAAPRGALTLTYEGDALMFEQAASDDAVRTRNRWVRQPDGVIRVIAQRLGESGWEDGRVTFYTRDGDAPPIFAATNAPATGAGAGALGWLGELAGACWRGEYVDGAGQDRQCYAWQYTGVLRVSAAINAGDQSHAGEAVYLPNGAGVQMYYWSDAGHFGAGAYEAEDDHFILRTTEESRSIWTRLDNGFLVEAQRRVDGDWSSVRTVEYHRD